MVQPAQPAQPAQQGTFYAPRPWSLIRVLFLIAAVCFLIAALTVATSLNIGPAVAWFYGGFAAWMLTGAV